MNSKPTLVHFIIFFSVLFLICIGIYSIDTDPKTDYSHLAPVGDTTTTELNKHVIKDTVWHYRIVKSVKVDNQTSTSYHYKYDWWNGKLRQQPRVESETTSEPLNRSFLDKLCGVDKEMIYFNLKGSVESLTLLQSELKQLEN
jgi:hypothetical protein